MFDTNNGNDNRVVLNTIKYKLFPTDKINITFLKIVIDFFNLEKSKSMFFENYPQMLYFICIEK